MAEEEPYLLCYNKGCGQKFKQSENTETSCRFHPGDHYFHDAYKGWTCCNRKTVDFTEFLNMQGCAYSFHSNDKPVEPEKKKEVIDDILIPEPSRPIYKPMDRPSADSPMIDLKAELSDSLKKQTFSSTQSSSVTEGGTGAPVPGETKCVNNGCSVIYEGDNTELEVCKFHPGVPIFHEGLKYWSCCQKRTTEFEVFMKQKGCTDGKHLWFKPKGDTHDQSGAKVIKCRHEWHQTGSHVIVEVYGKKFDPTKSTIKANGVKLKVELYFPEEGGFYREEWILAGIITPEECSVLMTPMKVELKLKKAEPASWKNLALPKDKTDIKKIEEVKNEYSAGVDAVDLSDL